MRYGELTTSQRLRASAATLAVHAGLIVLALSTGIAPLRPNEAPALTVFDVTPDLAPPPLPPEISPPPHERPAQPAEVATPRAAGGHLAPAAPTRVAIDAPAPAAVRATATIDAPPVPPLSAAPVATGVGSPSGDGGQGMGTGSGAGNGERADGGAPQRFQRADWIAYPSDAVINRYWPREAVRLGIGGEVLLACAVRRPGHPDRCIAVVETPKGIGFADAALRLSRTFRIRPNRINGRDAADLPVMIPITFKGRR
ncbi:protein TonB [Sphingomonas jinjuensis]|uniref:Protein TonB n=1 Tax=Sphingomonas jinjuensis TaxID=535907 RepID=A0A840FG29_9SPHN|nr:energy transducer TonB [Sphingomonas jinjuensis]MBB4154674.1 protein TonB [Sphingomonas jinjuensis]